MEKSIAKGHKVPEVQITTLIELLMRQAVKLDNISAEGEAASSKNSQVTLDRFCSSLCGQQYCCPSCSTYSILILVSMQGKRVQTCVETLDVLKVSNAKIKPVVVTTTWETFDLSPARPSNPRMTGPWELFD